MNLQMLNFAFCLISIFSSFHLIVVSLSASAEHKQLSNLMLRCDDFEINF